MRNKSSKNKQKDVLGHLPDSEKLRELYQSFYGTVVDRDPSEGISRQKHLHDGWRSGKSKPFEWEEKVFDVGETIDSSVRLFNSLHDRIIQALHTEGKI